MSMLKIVTLSIIVVFLLCGLTTREAEANQIDNEVIDGNKQCGNGLTEGCTPAIHKSVKVEQDENKDGDEDIKVDMKVEIISEEEKLRRRHQEALHSWYKPPG
ncbi:hypothetical protein LINPERPRIM_LOCUS3591 [Linum perenne]